MVNLLNHAAGEPLLLMGNEAIAQGAIEAGISVAAGYPGTPSSEIIDSLARVSESQNIYVEWSANEKVALEVAAAGSLAGLRSLCVMKQNGVNVASDFLLHLAGSGTRGGMVLVPCDDPGALSSVNEGDSRHFARLVEIPLLEPGSFQEAKDMVKWAFTLSEEIQNLVMVRSVTRLSHASGRVVPGDIPKTFPQAFFKYDGHPMDPVKGVVSSAPVGYKHDLQQQKLKKAIALFERSAFNTYKGPKAPELLIITSSACHLYSQEAIRILGQEDRVGLLKLGTTWPLPPLLMEKAMKKTDKILIVEEVIPFLEETIKILGMELAPRIGIKTFFGKNNGFIPTTGELNPDLVLEAVKKILNIDYKQRPEEYIQKSRDFSDTLAPVRDLAFCPGCPHRASFWSIHNALAMDHKKGFVCGDIGCYSLDIFPAGLNTMKTLHSMGSGTGLASGFGRLGRFGMDQPVLAVCGDSTFYHAVLPALVNAIHNKADMTLVILDNYGTAMTGFQPHPGLPVDAVGNKIKKIDIAGVCRAMGAIVKTCDPFDLEKTRQTLLELMADKNNVNILILKKPCALSPERKAKKYYEISLDPMICLGENCGCNRFCTRIFRCPGLIWDETKGVAGIDEVICAGCGVCASICPSGAIQRKEII